MLNETETLRLLEKRVAQLNRRIERLIRLEATTDDPLRKGIAARLDDLRARREDLETRLEDLRTAPFVAYGDIRAGMEFALSGIKEALDNAMRGMHVH